MPPPSLISLMASLMPSRWYWPGLASRPVMGITTPMGMSDCAAAAGGSRKGSAASAAAVPILASLWIGIGRKNLIAGFLLDLEFGSGALMPPIFRRIIGTKAGCADVF